MKLSDIIKAFEENKSVLTEILAKYKRSLCVYYSRQYRGEPMLMVTDVFNAGSYGIVVPANEFSEALEDYLDSANLQGDDREAAQETISFNSIPLSKL